MGQFIICLFRIGWVGHFSTFGREYTTAKVGRVIFLTRCKRACCYLFKRIVPSERCDGQVLQVDLQTVLDFARTVLEVFTLINDTDDTAFVDGIVRARWDIGMMTTTHELLIDIQFLLNPVYILVCNTHATYITATVEGTYIAGIVLIVHRVTVVHIVEHKIRLQVHAHAFHIAGKRGLLLEVQATERRSCQFIGSVSIVLINISIIVLQVPVVNHSCSVVAKEYLVGNHIGTHLQFHQWLVLLGSQRSTVATDKH